MPRVLCDEPWLFTKAGKRARDGSIASGGIIARNPLVMRLIWFVDRSEDVGSLFLRILATPLRPALDAARNSSRCWQRFQYRWRSVLLAPRLIECTGCSFRGHPKWQQRRQASQLGGIRHVAGDHAAHSNRRELAPRCEQTPTQLNPALYRQRSCSSTG